MALDPELPLQALNPRFVQPIDSPFESASKATVLAERQQQLADLRDQAQARVNLRAALQQTGGDVEKAIPLVMQTNPMVGMKMQEQLQHFQVMNLQTQKAKLDHDEAIATFAGRVLGGASNQSEWDHGLAVMKHAGFDTSAEPEAFDPARAEYHLRIAMSAADRIREAREKSQEEAMRLQDERARTDQERKQARDAQIASDQAVREGRMAQIQQGQLSVSQGNLKVAQQREAREAKQAAAGAGNAGAGALSDEGADYAATLFRLTGKMPSLGMGGKEEKAAIINRAATQAKALDQSPAASIQKQAVYKADGASLQQMRKMASSAEAFETKALGQADIIADLSEKVGRTQFPLLNSAILAGKSEILGDKNTQLLYNAISTFTAEYAKIMEGSTGSAAASSDSSRAAAARLISAKLSKGTLAGTLDLMKKEMALTIGGYDAVEKHITERMGGQPSTPPPTISAPGKTSDPLGIR